VFYHLLRGASEELVAELGLHDPASRKRYDIADFNYLRNGGDVDQTIVNDVELYKELDEQFNSLGFSKEEILAVWRVTAAVLHVGELQFDGSTYDPSGKPCKIKNIEKYQMIAKLLGFAK
jgi:myosin heavy subunit